VSLQDHDRCRINLLTVAPGSIELDAIKVVFARPVGKYFSYLDVFSEFSCPAKLDLTLNDFHPKAAALCLPESIASSSMRGPRVGFGFTKVLTRTKSDNGQ